MITTSITRRYAYGLLQTAIKYKNIDVVEENLFNFIETIWQDKNFRKFISHPKLSFTMKENLLEKAIANRYEPLTLEFLKYLIKKQRINYIVPITYYFDLLNDKYQGVIKVEVISAYRVSEDFISYLKARLEMLTGRKVKFIFKTQPEMIAGIKVKIGDMVIENSLHYKLREFLDKIKI